MYKVHYTFLICVERDGHIFSMFFVLLTSVFLKAGLIVKSPLERFVEELFWTTLGTYTLYMYEQLTVIRPGIQGRFVYATAILCLQQVF